MTPSPPRGLLQGFCVLLQSGGLSPKAVPCLSVAWEVGAWQKDLLFPLKVSSPSRRMGHKERDH